MHRRRSRIKSPKSRDGRIGFKNINLGNLFGNYSPDFMKNIKVTIPSTLFLPDIPSKKKVTDASNFLQKYFKGENREYTVLFLLENNSNYKKYKKELNNMQLEYPNYFTDVDKNNILILYIYNEEKKNHDLAHKICNMNIDSFTKFLDEVSDWYRSNYFDKFTVWYLKRIFEQKFYDIFHSIVETQSNNCKSQITKVQNRCDKKCDRLLTEKNKSISEAQNKIASKLSIEIIEYILKNINVLLKKDIEKKLLLINTYIIDNSILNKILSSYFSHGYFYDDDSYDEPFSDHAIHLITPNLNNLIKSLQKV